MYCIYIFEDSEEVDSLTYRVSGSVPLVVLQGVGQHEINATYVGNLATQGSPYLGPRSVVGSVLQGCLPSRFVDHPRNAVGIVHHGCPSSPCTDGPSLLIPGLVYGPLCRGSQPKGPTFLPQHDAGPNVSLKPLPGACTRLGRFDDVHSTPCRPCVSGTCEPCSLPSPPGGRGAPLQVGPVIDPVEDQLRPPDLHFTQGLRKSWWTSANDKKNCKRNLWSQRIKVAKEERTLERMQKDVVRVGWGSVGSQRRNS